MSNEKNEVQVFEQQHMEVFQKLSDVVKTKKHLEDQEKKFKEQLEKDAVKAAIERRTR